MKKYMLQIYEEGFATTFLKRPLNFFKNKITNPKIYKYLEILLYILYTILAILLTILVFKWQFPL